MAILVSDTAMAGRRKARYAAGAKAARTHMWSKAHGCFVAVQRDTLQQVATPTVGGFMPLMARIPDTSQAAAMAAALRQQNWATPLPIPTVERSSTNYSSGEFWRGDVWPVPNYQVAKGLAAYGYRTAAAAIADRTIQNALKVGVSERYDSQTGEALGVKGLGMSATVITMMLDGLSSKYRLRTRRTSSA
jgi:glycogen debranching enzyme